MATATKESNGKVSTRGLFDWLNSEAGLIAEEILKRNLATQNHSTKAQNDKEEKCLVCKRTVKKGQKIWQAYPGRHGHKSCLLENAPDDIREEFEKIESDFYGDEEEPAEPKSKPEKKVKAAKKPKKIGSAASKSKKPKRQMDKPIPISMKTVENSQEALDLKEISVEQISEAEMNYKLGFAEGRVVELEKASAQLQAMWDKLPEILRAASCV